MLTPIDVQTGQLPSGPVNQLPNKFPDTGNKSVPIWPWENWPWPFLKKWPFGSDPSAPSAGQPNTGGALGILDIFKDPLPWMILSVVFLIGVLGIVLPASGIDADDIRALAEKGAMA